MGYKEDLYRSISQSFADILYAVDKKLNVIYWNSAAEAASGIPADSIVGKKITDEIPSIKDSLLYKKFNEVLKSGKAESFIEEFDIKGEKRVYGINLYPSEQGLTVFTRNISSYFTSDLSHRKSIELFRSTLDNLLEGCAILDFNWNYIYLNETHAMQVQIDRTGAAGSNFLELIPGFEKSLFADAFRRSMEQRIPRQVEDCLKFSDGNIKWFEIRSVPVPEGIFILSIETTERKKHEEERNRFDSVLKQSERMAHLGSWWIDLTRYDEVNENPLYWSEEIYRIFGYEPFSIEVSNDFFFSCVHPEDRQIVKDNMQKALSENQPYSAEHRIILPDGNIRTVYEHAEIRKNKEGIPESIVGAVQDVTEFREREREREILLSAIEQDRDIMRTIIESVPDEIWVFDSKSRLMLVNSAVKNGLGFDDLKNLTLEEVLTKIEIRHPDGRIRKPEESALYSSLKGEVVTGEEKIKHLKTGEYRYRSFRSAPMKDNSGKIFGVVVIVSDITERKKILQRQKELLKLSERRSAELNTIIESIPDAVFIGNQEGMTLVNKNALKLLGASSLKDFRMRLSELGKKFNVRWPESGRPLDYEELQFNRALNGETVINEILATNVSNGEDVYLRVAAAPVKANGEIIAAVAVESDITEKKKSEEMIKASLKEKEVLLRELYHRTKNNLQVISSLLGLRAADLEDSVVKGILEDMQNRVQTLALVHQKLYQSQNLSRVNVREYITDLVVLLQRSYIVSPGKIDFELDLEDINVLIDTAVPCGLIINELISNSLKYAFPGDRTGIVKISFKRINHDIIELLISDNGVGFKEVLKTEDYNLGLKLFHIIAQDQLEAEINLDTSDGVKWSVKFKDILYDERV